MFEKVKTFVGGKIAKCALVVSSVLPFAARAEGETSVVPDIGVNMSTYLSDLGTKLGVTLGLALGLAIAIWLVYMGWRLFKRIAK